MLMVHFITAQIIQFSWATYLCTCSLCFP